MRCSISWFVLLISAMVVRGGSGKADTAAGGSHCQKITFVQTYRCGKVKVVANSMDTSISDGQKADQQINYSEYKKFDAIMRPTKMELLMDGKKFMNGDVSDCKHLDKVDKKEFDISD